jgi:hypothetical protein
MIYCLIVMNELHLARLSLVRMTSLRRHRAKTFVFSGMFILQIILLLTIGSTGWIKVLYMELTEYM